MLHKLLHQSISQVFSDTEQQAQHFRLTLTYASKDSRASSKQWASYWLHEQIGVVLQEACVGTAHSLANCSQQFADTWFPSLLVLQPLTRLHVYISVGHTNPTYQDAMVTEFCMVAPKILRWFLGYWKICVPQDVSSHVKWMLPKTISTGQTRSCTTEHKSRLQSLYFTHTHTHTLSVLYKHHRHWHMENLGTSIPQ